MSLTPSDNPEHKQAAFWIACMEAQVWEMKESAAANDYGHFLKEIADCALVAFDALRLFSDQDAMFEILKRFALNIPKFDQMQLAKVPRTTEYYLSKIKKIKQALGPYENPEKGMNCI